MKAKEPFSFPKRLKSFGYAFAGIKTFFSSEHNAWIQLISAITAIGLGLWFDITAYEWLAIIFAIAIVFIAEMINTAIEQLTNMVSPQYSEKAKKVKDIAAGAVLAAAITAVVTGCIVFSKHLI